MVSNLNEPLNTFQDVILATCKSNFHPILVEVVAETSLLHNLVSQERGVLDLDDIVGVSDPGLETTALK